MLASAERALLDERRLLNAEELSALAALSGTKPSSATARCTRSTVSGRGLRRPFSTRETDAMDTPAARATS